MTRFRIALASLHNDATAQFARELIDGVQAGQGSGRDAIVDLTTAVDEGLTQAKEQSNATIELAGQVARQIEAVRDLLGVPQDLLANWQGQVDSAVDDALAGSRRSTSMTCAPPVASWRPGHARCSPCRGPSRTGCRSCPGRHRTS